MQQDINLSYIITTFQKLPYLKIVLPELIANRLDDEEIVIIDGGSKDGTAEWLQELHAQNKIQQFVNDESAYLRLRTSTRKLYEESLNWDTWAMNFEKEISAVQKIF